MATCRDCIYQKMCKAIDAIGEFQEGAECCNNFKDRSRFVELPCKVGDKVYLDNLHIKYADLYKYPACEWIRI